MTQDQEKLDTLVLQIKHLRMCSLVRRVTGPKSAAWHFREHCWQKFSC